MEKFVKRIQQFKEKYANQPGNESAKAVTKQEFTLLLSGISTCRKMPGIEKHMGYEKLYECPEYADCEKVADKLEELFGIDSKQTLVKACFERFSGCKDYEQFMTFWKDAPLFDISKLNEEGKKAFEFCKDLAYNFYPLVEEKGFYAWDINERIGLCRHAFACGLITEQDFWDITEIWVRLAQVFYSSFEEYAVSCICGAMYEMGRHNLDLEEFFNVNMKVLEDLLSEGGAWRRNSWYTPEKRELAVLMLENKGCLISARAVKENRIGRMYREEPLPGKPDSGWRFLTGDETEEELQNPNDKSVCLLNVVCNICPDIMAYLFAEKGREFIRKDGKWQEVKE